MFQSWGKETPHHFTKEAVETALKALDGQEDLGLVLRAKGIVPSTEGTWLHFDYVPGEANVREGSAGITGRLCVIGSQLNETALSKLFGLKEA